MTGRPVVLGTAQLGATYGVGNRSGAPDAEEARRMIATAWEAGVRTFDTAAAYGNAEEVLGRALAELGLSGAAEIVTKIRPLTAAELLDPAQSEVAIRESLAESRRRLGVERLGSVLFHREQDAARLDVLAALRDDGWCESVGVSVGNEAGPAAELARHPDVAVVQIPFNAFDPRHRDGGTLGAAAERGVTVFVRSVFLQGLLLMPERNIHPLLADVVEARRAFHEVAAGAGLTPAQLAVGYVLAQAGDVRVIVGAETAEQVRQNLALTSEAAGFPASLLAEVDEAVGRLPTFLITPNDWVGKIPPGWSPDDEIDNKR